MSFTVIIPARFASTRLPGKPLANIAGKPMIVRVMEQARQSGAARIIVATDHHAVAEAVKQSGGEVCLTCATHQSGTERLAEVIDQLAFDDDEIIVNVQGDEPLIPPVIIQQVANNLINHHVGMATLAVPISNKREITDPNTVKVQLDHQGFALYFSRAAIPWDRDNHLVTEQQLGQGYLRHIGIYAYRAGFIRRYINWPITALEQIEKLEQLRVLYYGEKIHVAIAEKVPSIGVDTPEDLMKVQAIFAQHLN